MRLPFSTDQFFRVFSEYNLAVWPAQVVLLGLALIAVLLIVRPRRRSGRIISVVLAALWAWLGLAYHVAFFARINDAAYAFAAVSLAGAALFLWQGAYRSRMQFRWQTDARSIGGIALITFALVGYPLWTWVDGHTYPAMPTFGLPCPTTLFTLGVLCFLVRPYPRSPLAVPLAWCIVGSQAAVLLDVHPDLSLVVAGAVGIALVVVAGRVDAADPSTDDSM